MDIDKIPLGKNPPYDFNVIIEIPQGGYPVKYELDKKSGAMYVDRFLNTSMTYPANYGFIPHTLAADGDPCDVLVIGRSPVIPGAVIRARPIGALIMTDEAGSDDKIIAVPVDALNPYYAEFKSYADMPQMLRDQVAHFFQHYKDLEKGKWVAGIHWVDYEDSLDLVRDGIKRAGRPIKTVKSKATAATVKKHTPKKEDSVKIAVAEKETAVKKAATIKSGTAKNKTVKKAGTVSAAAGKKSSVKAKASAVKPKK